MPSVPILEPREDVAVLTALGIEEIRQRGSHKRFPQPDERRLPTGSDR